METREMKNIGVTASLLGFGCMRFPTLSDGTINEPEAEYLLDYAMEHGVTYYDTAYPYHSGASEAFVGRALDKYPRESYLLATKLPSWYIGERGDVRKYFEDQLTRMHKDYFDFYLLHAMNRTMWDKLKGLGVIEECEALQKEGKIKHFGFSFHDSYDVFEEIITYRKWDFCQLQINYMDKDVQAGLKGLALAERLNVPVIVMEPVKGGQLAALPGGVNQPLKDIDSEASDASWAMRWVGTLPNVAVILSGMSTKEQVVDNIQTFSDFKPLNHAESAAIDAVADALRARVKNDCTACKYCMPCPAGVNIPGTFAIWNGYGMYENKASTLHALRMQLPDDKKPHNCIECGRCEAVCPQKIAIREDLKQAAHDFDTLK